MIEEERYRNGAKYFKKDFESLTNKRQYKEECYLNTGLSKLRTTREIKIFTSCIVDTDYLYRVVTKDCMDVVIYYFNSTVRIEGLINHYHGTNVRFVKISRDPFDEFNHKTIVFGLRDTVIFDNKYLGYYGKKDGRNVYRDKSERDFELYYERAVKLI